MSDALLFMGADGGDIELTAAGVTMSEGLEAACMLSLFGGNEEDDGTTATAHLQWWGNALEVEGSARRYRSQTAAVIEGLPLTSSNLRRLQDAADNDLAWMTAEGVASAVDVAVTVQGTHRVQIDVEITTSTGAYNFTFNRDWVTS